MKIHFVAIGGSVMHQLALALHQKGEHISGSDDEIFEPARSALMSQGLLPQQEGWFPDKIDATTDAVILGMHAKADNPELAKARSLGIPVYSFPEYVFEASRNKKRIVVGGSHGKTTTTSMIMHVLQASGLSFDYLVGARLPGFDQSVSITSAPWIVCEGDEYPASTLERRPKFHFLFPHIAVLTGIAWDHINVFPTFENYLEQFRIFIGKIESGGHLIYNCTDEHLVKLVEESRRSDVNYISYDVPQHHVDEGRTTLSLEGCRTELQVFGNHNLLNIHAAWQVCKLAGVKPDEFCKAIASFTGADKRLQVLAENNNTIVYRDFAHAPSKVRATVEAVKQQFPQRKIFAVLELHTFSSLSAGFLDQYKGSLDAADQGAVYFSRHALELKRLPPLAPSVVHAAFGQGNIEVFDQSSGLQHWLQQLQPVNAVILFMSSGNYDGFDISAYAHEKVAAPGNAS